MIQSPSFSSEKGDEKKKKKPRKYLSREYRGRGVSAALRALYAFRTNGITYIRNNFGDDEATGRKEKKKKKRFSLPDEFFSSVKIFEYTIYGVMHT